MRFKQVGNKKDIVGIVFQNDESSVTIKAGAPIFQKPNGTVAGLSCISAESQATATQGFFAGISFTAVAAAAYGEAQVFGMYEYARILQCTRAASTDVWESYAALAIGDVMNFITTADVQAVQRRGAGSAASVFLGHALAGTSYASFTTGASSLSSPYGNSTASVILGRVHIRTM